MLARKYIFISARPRRGCISNGDERDKRDPRDLRTFRWTSTWMASNIDQSRQRGYSGTGSCFRKTPIQFLLRDVCYIYRSPDTTGVYVTRYITRSTSVSQVPFLSFHISSGRCGRNDIFTEALALTLALKIFVFATPRKWQGSVKSP